MSLLHKITKLAKHPHLAEYHSDLWPHKRVPATLGHHRRASNHQGSAALWDGYNVSSVTTTQDFLQQRYRCNVGANAHSCCRGVPVLLTNSLADSRHDTRVTDEPHRVRRKPLNAADF